MIPLQLTAGDSASWLDAPTADSLGNAVTSADWTLSTVLRGPTGLTLAGVAEGQGWKTTITAAQSAQLVPGRYYWQAAASKAAERVTIGAGPLTVLANLAFTGTATAYDGRSQTEIHLEAVRAEMHARITGGSVQEYTIGNRSLKKIPMPDLIALESKLKNDLVREKRAANPGGRATFVRF